MRFTQSFGRIAAAFILLSVLPVATVPAAAESPSEKADALLHSLIGTNEPGAAVLVAQNGKILFEKGYGSADLAKHVPITPQTIFRIGSDTKQFTAAAILKLQEQGKLSVNDKLAKYIPDFPRGDQVTLSELLHHTSGIHDYIPSSISDVEKPIATEAVIKAIEKQPYDFDPGTQWHYDNTGYFLIGYIVEKVSGQTYGEFLSENFFQPLGMTSTGDCRMHHGLPREALGYTLGTNGFEPPYYIDLSWNGGDGALYSTVQDLYRWNEGIFNGRVLDAASLKAAFTPVATGASQVGYGFGWFIRRYRGLREISHGGAVPGFVSMLVRLPDEEFTVVVLANADGKRAAIAHDIAYKLVDIYLANKLAHPAAAKPNEPKSKRSERSDN